ncbi:hypothetical protein PR202_gb25753 [Eleusine coracana subsp. coracana]|uniref:Secreted protein n=1 Tax=Eleusine coracana subsp. coracana TaxID=191504 RepID=A0AAV5FMH7_ELECO|nr:hypothetical protein PR202_gb25753 [Eleusine coracana subsp. coracana]
MREAALDGAERLEVLLLRLLLVHVGRRPDVDRAQPSPALGSSKGLVRQRISRMLRTRVRSSPSSLEKSRAAATVADTVGL